MRSVIVVLLACATAVVLGQRPAHTQPAPGIVDPDLDRARALYASAELALADARLEDAIRDYRAAYEITRDPALLYKLGVAHQKANACRLAVAHFAAYLRIGKPTPDFFALTREKIRVCGYDPDGLPPDLEDPTVVPAVAPVTAGSATGSASTEPGSGERSSDGSGSAGSAAPKPIAGKHRAAWILVGGAIAMATVGAVLAYSANAAESDVDDLYVGLGGQPPAFDAATRQRFDDLVAEGKRDERLAWASFGVAAVLGGLAAWRFTVKEERVLVTPTLTPSGASVTAGFRF